MTPRALLVLALLLGFAAPAAAQRNRALATTALSGQRVAVLPVTLVVADPALQADSALYARYRDRRTTLLWADSIIGEAFLGRAPEVNWVLPPELRKLARRSPGMIGDPDQMGQAVLRSQRLKEIPEPFRAELRNLLALVGGRVALVPAALGFGREADGRSVRADLTVVLGDARSGKILWRTLASGAGPDPEQALNAALATLLPVDSPPGP